MADLPADAPVRVLYFDDDAALVRLLQKTLGRRGFEVVPTASRSEALARIAAGVDVVALDHYLPEGSGLDFLAELGRLEDPPPVVYVTGTSEMNVAVAALKAGASDFVPKTVGDEFQILLATALREAVEKARLRAQKEAAEREVRKARDRAEMLLAEVNHRVANSLALVASMVSLQAKAVASPQAKAALGETQARIFAIGLVHRRLYSSGDVRFVALDEYLAGLLDHLDAAMKAEGHGAALTRSFEPMQLRTDLSINLGVVVTEWVTNAFKYAYPDGTGEVRVALRRLDGERAELTVADDGIGRRDDQPVKGTGLGSRLVTAMAASMHAEAEYRPRGPGTLARLVFSLGSEDDKPQ